MLHASLMLLIAVALTIVPGSPWSIEAEIVHGLTTEQLTMSNKIATCRAHCVDGFGHRLDPMTNTACSLDSECLMCWENCEMFYRNFQVWGSICSEPAVCFEGCQLACSVYRNQVEPPDHRMLWSFPTALKILRFPEEGRLEVDWDPPVPLLPVAPPLPRMVYVLFWTGSNEASVWYPLNHTVATYYFTRNPRIVNDAHGFMVIAFNRDGRAAVLRSDSTSETSTGGQDEELNLNDQNKHVDTGPSVFAEGLPKLSGRRGGENLISVTFVLSMVGAVVLSSLVLTLGGWLIRKVVADLRRRRSLSRENALRFKRHSFRDFSMSIGGGSTANLLRVSPMMPRSVQDQLVASATLVGAVSNNQFPTGDTLQVPDPYGRYYQNSPSKKETMSRSGSIRGSRMVIDVHDLYQFIQQQCSGGAVELPPPEPHRIAAADEQCLKPEAGSELHDAP